MEEQAPEKTGRPFGCLHLLGIVAVAVLVSVLGTAWWVRHNIYASSFSPTELTERERDDLEVKLTKLDQSGLREKERPDGRPAGSPDTLAPEAYSEDGADREVQFTEKELNGLIADDPETARRVAIDLAEDLVSVKLLVPVDEEVPLLGGKTLRLKMGVGLAYEEGRPVVALRGVTLGGVPLPNAWLGNVKHKNLVDEFGSETGFWKLFSEGVENIRVKEGHISIRLRE